MKVSLILTILLFLVLDGFSTNQIEDYIIIENDTLFLYDSPLEQIDDISQKINKIHESGYLSSDCWRGFYAEWKLIDNNLFLSKVFECESDKTLNKIIEKVLGTKFTNGLINADWVNGILWCGKDLVREQTLYLSVYRHELGLRFDNGNLTKRQEYKCIECEYTDNKKFKNYVLNNLNWQVLPENDEFYLIFEIELNLDKNGKIKNAKILKSDNHDFSNEIVRVLNNLPCWNVYFREGIIYNDKDWIDLEIYQSEIKKYKTRN